VVLTRCAQRIEASQRLYDRERAEADDLVTELRTHPPERQILIVENHSRFHTWGVFSHLLDRTSDQMLQSPSTVEHLSGLALRVADRLDTDFYRAELIEDLRARAWSYIGNAYRQRSDLAKAEEAFRTAAMHLREGTGDPVELAMLLDLQASLLRAQRRFGRAMTLLKRAHKIFLFVGDRHRAGRAIVSMEIILYCIGDPERGIPLLYRALELIDPEQEPRLVLCVWHNLADDLAEAGRAMEARRLFIKARSLYPRFPEAVTHNRRTWLAGKISRGLGQVKEAEALFVDARQAFEADQAPYDVALVSLDLAGLYAEQGRIDELKRLAAEIVPVFSSRQIHREALAALVYWKRAVEAETARERIADIANVVAEVAGFLKRVRYDPDLRFTDGPG